MLPTISPSRDSIALHDRRQYISLSYLFAKVIFMCILCDHTVQKSFYLPIVFKNIILSSAYFILGYTKLYTVSPIN